MLRSDKPKFITFTGVDEMTDPDELIALHREYPVEFGILVGGKAYKKRYPSHEFISAFLKHTANAGLNLSLHLCVDFAKNANTHGAILNAPPWQTQLDCIKRMQINALWYNSDTLAEMAARLNVQIIKQHREGPFSEQQVGLVQVHDCSGGRGVVAVDRPRQPSYIELVGYAGGLNPHNVKKENARIEACNYWLDMESGVRDENDLFAVEKCRKVCEEIYG